MSDDVAIVSSLLLALAVLFVLFRRGATRNGLFIVAAFFVLFAYGPAVNYLLGWDIYAGIAADRIQQACGGFALALVGILAADLLLPQRFDYGDLQLRPSRYRYDLLPFGLIAVAGYALFHVIPNASSLIVANKPQALAIAGPWHYSFMSLATSVAAFYFVTRRSLLLRRLYLVFVACFVLYCIAFRERDFFLIFVAILIHREIVSGKKRTLKVIIFGVASALGATWLFTSRGGDSGVGIQGVLNQGSILFVDTFLMTRVPDSIPYEFGQTYVDAIARLVPEFIYSSGSPTLSQQLVQWYNPGSTSGYGFSLTGEAFLNFGMAGIPSIFFIVALLARFLMNNLDRGDLFPFMSVFFLQAWMYALRGDSLQLVKTSGFALIVFAVFRMTSTREVGGASSRSKKSEAPGRRGRAINSAW